MFKGASKFDRDLSAWNPTKVAAEKRVDFNTGTPMPNNALYQPKWTG